MDVIDGNTLNKQKNKEFIMKLKRARPPSPNKHKNSTLVAFEGNKDS